MAMSKEVLGHLLSTIEDQNVRNAVAESLTRESTELSEIEGQLLELTDYLQELNVEELCGVGPDALQRDLQGLDRTITRLYFVFEELADKVGELIDASTRHPRRTPSNDAGT